MNVPTLSDTYTRPNLHITLLKVKAQATPDMTVNISVGQFWVNGAFVEFPGGNTTTITAPTTNPKFVVVGLLTNGGISIITGVENATPVLPAMNADYLPLAAIILQVGDTVITENMIYDLRSVFNVPFTSADHNDLSNRLAISDCHDIAGITNLQTTLDSKLASVTATGLFDAKADQDGTDDLTFILNKDFLGAAVSDASIEVERGSDDNVSITWDESDDRWLVREDLEVFSVSPGTDLKGVILMDSAGARYRVTVAVGGGSLTISAI